MLSTTTTRPSWTDRIGPLSGAAYVVLILVGNQLAEGGGGPAHPTGAQVLDHLDEKAGSVSATIGLGMEVASFVAFALFLGWLVDVVRRGGGRAPWLGTTALIGGLTMMAVKIGSALPAIALDLNRDAVDDTTARLLNDMNSAGFVISFVPFGIFMAATGVAMLDSHILGRVTALIAVVLGTAGVVVTIGTGTDPVNTNPIPFLLSLIWILVVGVRLGIRRTTVVPAGETVPVPASA